MKDFQLLVSAIEKAQQSGVYTLQEIDKILQAIKAVGDALKEEKGE